MKTKIILLRHCQSLANQERIYAGRCDFDLSELGFKQAEEIAETVRDAHIDVIYSSDLKRAYHTALPHARIRGIEVIRTAGLREIHLGEADGMYADDLFKKYPYEFGFMWTEFFGLFAAPGGENSPGVAERIYGEIMRIARDNPGKTVLCTAHAAAIRLFWGKISGFPPEQLARLLPFPTNGSFSTLEFDGENLIPIEYSRDEIAFDGASMNADE